MIELKNAQWGQIRLADIFDAIPRGKVSDLKNVADGKTIIIAASGANEGFSCFSNDEPISKNAMTISFNGVGTGTAFVHNYLFNLNSDCGLVKPKENISLYALRFIAVSINQNKNKFNYGYKANESRILRQTVLLPISDDKGNSDYEYMAKYTRQKRETMLDKYHKYVEARIAELGELVEIPMLDEKEWDEFFIGDLFEVSRPKSRNKDDYDFGNTPFVASGALNNGVMKCCDAKQDEQLDAGNCITVSPVDGSTFYQPMDFLGRGGAGSSILMLRSDWLNLYLGQFIARTVRQTCSKYTYGHMGNKDSIKRERIMLPIDDSGKPDYEYMEQYAKNMMLRKYKQYLEFVNRQNVTEVD